jgi:DNA-binding NarL/FixJ family response regulator
MSDKVKVLIADDHTIVRQGISRLLKDQSWISVVGEAENGKRALEMAMELKPDVVIMDIAMPVLNGIEASKRIKKLLPKTKVIILSMYSYEHYINELLETGVSGYLLKDSSGRDIVNAIQAAIKNETYLSPGVSKVVVESYLSPTKRSSKEERYKALSDREREVLQLIAEGYSTKQIADMLCVSISTVKTHRINIMDKLGLDSQAKLIRFALQLGLVDKDL